MMTFGQYRRLLLIALVPLLIGGWFYVKSQLPTAANIICKPYGCQNFGSNFPSHEDASTWVWLEVEEFVDNPIYIFGYAKEQMLPNVKVTDARPSYDNPDQMKRMAVLIGQNISINLENINEIDFQANEFTTPSESRISLFCPKLIVSKETETFKASCRADTWDGEISFTPSDAWLQESLTKLRAAIIADVDEFNSNVFWAKVIWTPVFLYLFLAISVFLWLATNAFRFIMRG